MRHEVSEHTPALESSNQGSVPGSRDPGSIQEPEMNRESLQGQRWKAATRGAFPVRAIPAPFKNRR